MRVTSLIVLSHALIGGSGFGVFAVPTVGGTRDCIISDRDDVLLLDAPGFPDPKNAQHTLAGFQSYVFERQMDIKPVVDQVTKLFSMMGIDIGNKSEMVTQRLKLFAAKGEEGKTVELEVDECHKHVAMAETARNPTAGSMLRNASIGHCGSAQLAEAKVVLTPKDNRSISANVFISPNEGFGVISDIDDTVKVTEVLNTVAALKNTFLEDPKPVPGMPELYASLSKSLDSPPFVYISGSMVQLYPFLRGFINSAYSESNGAIFLQNFTFVDITSVISFLAGGDILDYKLSVIDNIHGMYPNKKFLAVGDSTQKDPETYAKAFLKYSDFISCTWIRLVDGANNTAERFEAAFQGVPPDRFRLFNDTGISSLRNINVARGDC
ncbi:hypothetical protein AMATHDRAFT_3575 [Amanita thiersii Skay4041]|uniref:Phosphatidate phosphatase APP1 catalytic domain-containing protein n=1 Tax=Amanita thiersii Skay4041 TaxID=703135 RepID=A0A2A9NL70_9AGAR|nr:hypothetical protein AMATHDRAFT_3575 [Amanita thiersii Skay4041]